MEKPFLLHLLTTAPNASPFDVNMAYDAGWDAVMPYTSLSLADVESMVQDAIFSRGPKGVRRTGLFIGGRDVSMAMDMVDQARRAMVPPFEASVFADPSGAFTTAAAMVAAVEDQLKRVHGRTLADCRVTVFGGTGPVGSVASVLAAGAGARVRIASHEGSANAQVVADACSDRYGVEIEGADSSNDNTKSELMAVSDVVLATAKAGIQIIGQQHLAHGKDLLVAADVNAVPPAGIEGVDVQADGVPLGDSGAVGIGALAVGNIKYQVQRALLQRMREAEKAVYLDFRDAFGLAREHVGLTS